MLAALAPSPTSHAVRLAAYLPDGELDPAFAQGAGTATIAPPPHTHASGATVTQLSNGELVVTWTHYRFLGNTETRAEIFDAELTRETTFAHDGVFASTDAVYSWTLAGKYLYAISTPLHGTESLLRLKRNGRIDHSFGTDGKLDLVAALGDSGYRLLGAAAHSLYLAVTPTSGDGGGAIERVGLDGTPDPTFGSGGVTQLVQPAGVDTVEPDAVSHRARPADRVRDPRLLPARDDAVRIVDPAVVSLSARPQRPSNAGSRPSTNARPASTKSFDVRQRNWASAAASMPASVLMPQPPRTAYFAP